MKFENWEGGLVGKEYFGFKMKDRGILTASWNKEGGVELPVQESLFRLKFTATQTGLLSEMLQINSKYTQMEAYNMAEELLDIQLVFDQSNMAVPKFDLYQNKPNPFKEQTVIGFYLPEASFATLTIMDLAGKVIKTVTNNYEKGRHEISLAREELPTQGILYYQLTSSAGKITKTMLVLD